MRVMKEMMAEVLVQGLAKEVKKTQQMDGGDKER